MDVQIPCPCPPKADGTPRHDSDTVTLRDTLDFRTRLSLRQTIKWAKELNDDLTDGEALAVLTEAYCLQCIDAWSLVDDKGKKLPPSRAEVRNFLEEHDDAAMLVADAADTMYSKVVLLPLLLTASKSSPPSPIDGSTSPKMDGESNGQTDRSSRSTPPTSPRRSRRSSTATSLMAVTGPMLSSPAGVSG